MGAEGLLVICPVLTMRTEVCMCLASEAKDMKDTYTTHHLRKRQVSDMQIRLCLCVRACVDGWVDGWAGGNVQIQKSYSISDTQLARWAGVPMNHFQVCARLCADAEQSVTC